MGMFRDITPEGGLPPQPNQGTDKSDVCETDLGRLFKQKTAEVVKPTRYSYNYHYPLSLEISLLTCHTLFFPSDEFSSTYLYASRNL